MRMRAAAGRDVSPPPQAPRPALLGSASPPSCAEGHAGGGADGADAAEDALDAHLEAIGFGHAQLRMMVFCGVAWLVDSVEQSGLGYAFPDIDLDWGTTVKDWGVLGSAKALCSMAGALGFGVVADRRGRRPAFRAALAVTAVCGVASAGATSFEALVVLRSLTSAGAGGLLPVSAALLAEHLPPSRRESCLALMQVFFATGTLLALALARWLLGAGGAGGWQRYVLALAAPPAALLVFGGLQVPESPAHLLRQGELEELQEALRGLAGRNCGQPLELGQLGLPKQLAPLGYGAAGGVAEPPAAGLVPARAVPAGLARLVEPGVRAKAALVGAVWACATVGSDFWFWVTELGAEKGVERHAVEGLLAVCKVVGIFGFLAAALAAARWSGARVLAWACLACGLLSFLLAALAARSEVSHVAVAATLLPLAFAYDMVWSLMYATTASVFDPACRATAISAASACSRAAAAAVPLASAALLELGGVAAYVLWAAGWAAAAAAAGGVLGLGPGAAPGPAEAPPGGRAAGAPRSPCGLEKAGAESSSLCGA